MSTGIRLSCTLSHRYFLLLQKTCLEPENCLQKHSTLVSLLLHTDNLGHVFSSCLIQKHAKISLKFSMKIIKPKLRRPGRPGHLLNVLCTFNLRPVSTGMFHFFFSILLVFLLFWLPYFSLNCSIFQFSKFFFSSCSSISSPADIQKYWASSAHKAPFKSLVLRCHAYNMTLRPWHRFATHKKQRRKFPIFIPVLKTKSC